jgi:hypothetical protein
MILNGQFGHYLNLNKFVGVCRSFGNIIIINSSYYDDFTFYRFLFELESFLGGLQPFCKTCYHVFNFCNYLFELETMLGKSTTYWRVLNGFFCCCMVMK